jgi:hypothetical protein
MNCKTCGTTCVIKVSKSQANMGKEFYSCPAGCQGWIGWVDNSLNVQIERKPAKLLPNAPKNDYFYNADGDIACKSCGTACLIKRSKSPKNMNREYYACQSNCNVWNGWVEESEKIVIPQDKMPMGNAPPSNNTPSNINNTTNKTNTANTSSNINNTTNKPNAANTPVTINNPTKNTASNATNTKNNTINTPTNTPTNTIQPKKNIMILPEDDEYDIDAHDEI